MEMRVEDVVIVGAGVAGLAMAVALKRVGVRALVLEKSKELTSNGEALTLFPNGWLALDALGVFHKFPFYQAPSTRAIVTDLGTGAEQELHHYRVGGEPRSMTILRKTLSKALADELPTDSIRFSSKFAAIETETTQEGSSIAIIHLGDSTIIRAKILIGCDGVDSVVARWLGLGAPVNSGRSASRGLSVFPEGHGIKQAFQQYVVAGMRAGLLPVSDKEVYWFFICNDSLYKVSGENVAGNPELIQREVIENYAKGFPPKYLEIVRRSDLSTVTWAPLKYRYPWDMIFGHLSKGNITVAGDVMHPVTPEIAQGACAALEDAVVLGRHIANSLIKNGRLVPGEIAPAIDGYVKERRWRATWLVIASYLSGWMQQGGSNWWMKFLRDVIFYRFLFVKIFRSAADFDCGKLPTVSFSGDQLRKID